jgi:hypothetical protein
MGKILEKISNIGLFKNDAIFGFTKAEWQFLHSSRTLSFLALALDPETAMMLMPKKNWIVIYGLLFKEGVMVAMKDVHMPNHPELADKNVPSLHVMKVMQSLKS